ncbi:MAG: acyl carrier protein [Euzebyales bacterium]|nr:acyl carrier protein [Euzebyales bacterium]
MTETPPTDPRLAGTLHQLFGISADDLHPEAELEADLQLDSLSVVELQVALEEVYGVRIEPEEPSSVRTVGDLQRQIAVAVERGEPVMPVLKLSDEA